MLSRGAGDAISEVRSVTGASTIVDATLETGIVGARVTQRSARQFARVVPDRASVRGTYEHRRQIAPASETRL